MKTPDLFFSPSPKQSHWFVGMALVGGCCLGTGLFFAPDRVWPTFLLLNYYLLGLGLAGLVFIAIQYVTDAGWCVAFSRVPEALLNLIPFASVGLLTIWFVHPSLYPWVETARDEIHGFKRIWLNYPFFLCRSFLYLLVWNLFAWLLIRNSRRQDDERDLSYTYQNTCLSAVFLVAFAITFCLASFDWIMSLEPEWYSTIFGIYHFAGMFQSGLAIIVILSVWVNRSGIVQGMVTEDHLHDLGKLLFAFCTFWIYIWFSQYLLIWYANIPEETVYFIPRVRGMWGSLFLLLPSKSILPQEIVEVSPVEYPHVNVRVDLS